MSEITKIVKIGKNRLANGRFGPKNNANPNGRPRKPEVEELRIALENASKKNNKSFLQHFIERAYLNDNVAIALAKKIVPDKLEGEGFGNFNLHAIIQQIQQDFLTTHSKTPLELDKRDDLY